MSTEAARAVLEAAGYELVFREGEWVECLLLKDVEAWIGRGRDRDSALLDAVQKACPSSLALALFNEAMERRGGQGRSTAESIVAGDPERAQGFTPIVSTPAAARTQAVSRIAMPRSRSQPPPLVRRDAGPARIDAGRALDELEILGERIRDSREELGLCSPERQRLAMLAWICEARAHTDTFPEDARIRDRVGSISRQLTEIGKTFWPGSVTALQLQMQPRDLPRHVLGGPASTWARAAELAERSLRTLEYTDERRGYDAYGWADAGSTRPSPQGPERMLEGLITDVEGIAGPLAHNAVPQKTEARPDPDSFQRWVRRLRWLRGSDVNPDRWARVAGRLRWWACHREAPLVAPARELEASYMPDQSWARELNSTETSANGHSELASFPDHVLEDVRSAMSGKRLVFVSTRRDPDLQAQLKDALPSAALDWRVAEPRRLEALGEAIQHGAYDVVLGAVGFQSQGTDALLARACKLAGVRYLRVNRGRPIACLRALARDLAIG
jgi:hypothetical protein